MKKKKNNYAKWGYIFSIPFVIAFALFMLYPAFYTAVIGFTDLKGLGKTDYHILANPFQNYSKILKNQSFLTSLSNTFKIWIWNFIPQMLLALILAAWFTDNRMMIKGKGFFKVVFYMPNIITAATVAVLFSSLFGFPKGPMNDFLISLKVIKEPFDFSLSKLASQLIIAFIQFWQWYGYTMIVLISGILGISPDIYEAAEIDGANGFKKFIYFTINNTATTEIYTLITSLVGGLNMFDIPHLYQGGKPDNSTLTTNVFIFQQAYSGSYLYNRASAASMILFAIIAVLSAIVFYILRDKDEAKLRKLIKEQEKAYKLKLKEQNMAKGEN